MDKKSTEPNPLFIEITSEESAVVSGGSRRGGRSISNGSSAIFDVNLAQIVFALGAYQFTLALTGNAELANSVLTTQFNRAFRSFF